MAEYLWLFGRNFGSSPNQDKRLGKTKRATAPHKAGLLAMLYVEDVRSYFDRPITRCLQEYLDAGEIVSSKA